MRVIIPAATALLLSAIPLVAQGIPYLSASAERGALHNEYGEFPSYGVGAALGARGPHGFVQVEADLFPGESGDPGWTRFGMEGGPRLESNRWAGRAHVGAGGTYIQSSGVIEPPICEDYCPLDLVIAPQRSGRWSSYVTAGGGVAWRATPSLDVGLYYQLAGVLIGADRGSHTRGWSLELVRALR